MTVAYWSRRMIMLFYLQDYIEHVIILAMLKPPNPFMFIYLQMTDAFLLASTLTSLIKAR